MTEISVSYEGDLQTKAVHTPSGTILYTDAPPDNRGQGRSFSSTDLVAVALGTCYLTVMGIAAEDRSIDMKGTKCVVEKYMSTDSPRRIVKLVANIIFPEGIPFEKRGILEAVAMHCPVCKSLHPDIDVDLRLHFPDGQEFEEHVHHEHA